MLFEESGTLTKIGSLLWYNLIGSVLMSVEFGIYILASAITLHLLYQKGLQKPRVITLFTTQLILIVISIWQFTTVNGELLAQLFDVLANPKLKMILSQQLEDRLTLAMQTTIWTKVGVWPANIKLLIGDSIVAYRAWVLWRQHTIVRWVLGFLGISNAVVNIIDGFYSSGIAKAPSSGTLRLVSQSFFLIVSVSLNVLATMLIVYKTWTHANATRHLVADSHSTLLSKRSPSLNLLVFLVESGTTFFILQAGFCISLAILVSSPKASDVLSANIVSDAVVMALGFYPTSVTIVAHFMLDRDIYI
ncbi:hypothetical protein BDP27DRAFT_296142 [Rhodocollybia butyracea]|uniref:Uncharacterized protein n=1 Tax=Rhodocollybia butyracea TaxID=206335 RepID=A0A9P5PF85_9AGAR|nr:hypothetical protein BDP27DRAFT_296142 [Rhodocollybia butyracea]